MQVTQRGAQMYAQSMGVPLLGLVENMSEAECSGCGAATELFDRSGVAAFCATLGVEVWARLPLVPAVGAAGDGGVPMMVAQPQSEYAQRMAGVAQRVQAFLKLE